MKHTNNAAMSPAPADENAEEIDPRDARATDYGVAIMTGIRESGKHVYQGNVAPAEIAARRRRSRAARVARRANRNAG